MRKELARHLDSSEVVTQLHSYLTQLLGSKEINKTQLLEVLRLLESSKIDIQARLASLEP